MLSRAILWLSALGLLAWAVWLWPDVPTRIPTHFGASGEPDVWSDRSLVAWFTLPLVGLATAAFIDGLTVWSLRDPSRSALNLPNKDAILALPPERQAPVLRHVRALMHAVGVLCVLSFAMIHAGTWHEATGHDGTGWVLGGVMAAVVGPLGALLWGIVRINAEVTHQQREARAAAA